jgi:predicted patatin/cPLA2 family phospholipase
MEYKTGLILEGGAMRGLFTCGVIDVLMENGIRFDGAIGISAGAVFGCNYKSGQIGRPVRYNKNYCRDPRYCSYRSLIKTGDLYGAEFCYHEIPDKLDPFDREAFRNDPMEFYIGATDVNTGKCVYHKCTDGGAEDIEWMRASASMPIASRPVLIGGNLYLDGGIADSIPFKYMESIGYNHNVIVLTQPSGYVKKKFPSVMNIALRKYPAIAEGMAKRHEMYNRQIAELEERENSGVSFVIRPPESIGIGRTEKDPDKLEKAYQMGRRETLAVLPHLRAFMERRP